MKVLLISDSSMNVNKGGFSQTLYNIFSFLNPEDLLFITSSRAVSIAPTSFPFDKNVLTYNLELIPFQRNRLDRFLNDIIIQFNYTINSLFNRFKKIRHAIENFNADVVVMAPNGADGVFIYDLLKESFSFKKVVPYFMDDWLYQSNIKWLGGSIHALAKKLLSHNTSWMMISDSLTKILSERYSICPTATLVIHNPVDIKNLIKPKPVKQKKAYTIAYAGALWAMHFDAFIVIAKAIQLLQKAIAVKLVVYTDKSNWDWRQQELATLNAEYGGHIPYAEIHSILAKADCLLLTSSFSKEWQTHSRGSVQTKITDYLKAGRLIIACGPTYSANHNFLKKHQCGVCIETNNVQDVAAALYSILKNLEMNQMYVQHGYEVLEHEFNFEIIYQQVKRFLAA